MWIISLYTSHFCYYRMPNFTRINFLLSCFHSFASNDWWHWFSNETRMCIFFAELMVISMPKKDTCRDRFSADFLESHKEKLFLTKFYYITPFHSYQVQESFNLLQGTIEPNLVFILKVVSRLQSPKDCSLIFLLYVGKLVIKQLIH